MRIIGGVRRGKKLLAPSGQGTRPTTDRVRESLFNILSHRYAEHLQGLVLDAFCGTGALALEALSRGAEHAVLWDTDPQALKIARQNVEACGFSEMATLQRRAAETALPATQVADLVFLDPPYGKGLLSISIVSLLREGWLRADTLLVIERASGQPEALPGGLDIDDERRFGQTLVTLAYLAS